MTISALTLVRSLQAAIRWLKQSAAFLGDSRDIAITISALVAAERNPYSHLLQRLIKTLLKLQAADGSWNNEIWDTAWSLRALVDAGFDTHRDEFVDGMRFIAETRDSGSGTWYEEPFETMLVLDLYASIAPGLLLSGASALSWLLSLQQDDGRFISTHYTGMFASLLYRVRGMNPESFEPPAQRAIEWMRAQLESRNIWTEAAWSNCYAVRALLDSGAAVDDPAVQQALSWFLSIQDNDGKWSNVAKVDDTAMTVLVFARLLKTPVVEIEVPRTAVVTANRENGVIHVAFHDSTAGALVAADRIKISDPVRRTLSANQQALISISGALRNATPLMEAPVGIASLNQRLVDIGRYAYKNVVPARIRQLIESTSADHLRLDVDERLLELPWELIHDGSEFLCLRYAFGRRIMSAQPFPDTSYTKAVGKKTRALVIANPTGDLPAAALEGETVSTLLEKRSDVAVEYYSGSKITKMQFLLDLEAYEMVHFAGHAAFERESPDESYLQFADGQVTAFEIQKFLSMSAPSLVFLNACWSAEEQRVQQGYQAMMRGLGRTFLYGGTSAFIGYVVPVPDQTARDLAIAFYGHVAAGNTIGESLRRSRLGLLSLPGDVTWSSVVLYGDPAARLMLQHETTHSPST